MGESYNINLYSGFNGWFPLEVGREQLKRFLQEGFGTVGRAVLDDFFEDGSEIAPSSRSIIQVARPAQRKHELASILISEKDQADYTDEGISRTVSYLYRNKFVNASNHRGNGLTREMFEYADSRNPDPKKLSALRTGIPEAHEVYSRLSDGFVRIGDYTIHGFNFKQPGQNWDPSADPLFMAIAYKISQKPVSVVPLEERYRPAA